MSVLVSVLCSLSHLSMICTLNLHENCVSSLPIDLNVINDAPLTDLEKMFDSPLTSLPTIAPSFPNTPMDTSVSNLRLHASLLPRAQCMSLQSWWRVGLFFSVVGFTPAFDARPF